MRFLVISLIILTTLTVVGGVFFLPGRLHSQKDKILSANQVAVSPIPKVDPSPTPSPSPSPSPSPVDYGFCLNVPVLYYHHVEPMAQAKAAGHGSLTVDVATFDQQMAYLVSRGYKTIPAEQLAHAVLAHQKLPAKSIVVMIDDGYADLYTFAYPVIKKYNLTISLAIPTGLVDNPGYITWGQLSEMVGSGLFFAYDHTRSHAALTRLSYDQAQFEVNAAKKQLESSLGKSSDVFVYPYGSVNTQAINVLRANGFVAAFATTGGISQCESNIMALHRTRVGNMSLSGYGL